MAGNSGAAAMADHSRLGRGLASLIGDVGDEAGTTPEAARKPRRAPIEQLKPNPRNPRRTFTETELDELADFDQRARHHPADRRARSARTSATLTRSSPANGAGARRNAPACTTCRSPSSMRPTRNRSNSPSSKTCSAPTSIRSRRRPAISRSWSNFITRRTKSRRSSARAGRMSPTWCGSPNCRSR